MNPNDIQVISKTAAEARDHMAELEAERALALATGVADIDAYMHDLEVEIDFWRHHYVTAAVTEIATLHAELYGANAG
jgi:hypothetical protein